MLRLKEYRHEAVRLADLLVWAAEIAPGIILNKDGALQATVAFRGPDLESATSSELVAVSARLNNIFKRLRSGWTIFIEAKRRRARDYPLSDWPGIVPALIDEERRAQFTQGDQHLETAYYLTLVYQTPTATTSKLQRLLYEHLPTDDTVAYGQAVVFFREQVMRFVDLLKDVLPMVTWLSSSQTLSYLHGCVSTKEQDVGVPAIPMYIDVLVSDQDFRGGLKPMLGPEHLRTCSLKAFPNATFPGILDSLNDLGIEYRYALRYIALDRLDAVREIRKYERRWWSKRKPLRTRLWEELVKKESHIEDPEAVLQAADARGAQEAVAADHIAFGYCTATVTVWDTSARSAEEKLALVERAINGQGFVTHTEDLNAVEAWLGSLPGNVYANVRRPLLHSLNLAHLMPAAAVWAGPEHNRHLDGPPLLYATSMGNTPFRLCLHDGDVADTIVVGPKGSGKSLLFSLGAVQSLRYPGQQNFLFEIGGSAKAITLGVGGQHYGLGGKEGLAFQPLADIDDDDERAWYAEWVTGLFSQEGLKIVPSLKEETWLGLCSLATTPRAHRTMTGLAAVIQSIELRQALRPYTLEGPAGHLLDAAEEQLGDAAWQCFELRELLDTPSIVAPTLLHIFHRLRKQLTGVPTTIWLDDVLSSFHDPVFGKQALDWSATLRKSNAFCVYSAQSLSQIVDNPVGAMIANECVNHFWLANPRAIEPEVGHYYERFGMNTRQRELIARMIPKKQYYYTSRLGNRLFELGCGPITLAFCGASTPEDLATIEALWQGDPDTFAEQWLIAQGLDWAAALVREALGEKEETQ